MLIPRRSLQACVSSLAGLTALFLLTLPAQALPAAGYKGMVASPHHRATEIGVEVLAKGGNAADAACAVAFALGVLEQHSSGLAGGGFALLHMEDQISFLDFRERAPSSTDRDSYLIDGVADPTMSRDGVFSAGVPGAVAGYLELQEKHGRLNRRACIKPALDIARKGFVVSERFRGMTEYRKGLLAQDPEAARILLRRNAEGELEAPAIGSLFKQPELAWTLRRLMRKGPSDFYTGKIAERLVKDMRQRKGWIDAADLASYQVKYRKPLVGSFRGHTIVSSPPPSSGGQILLTILGILQHFEPDEFRSAEGLHRYIEASRFAYADRAILGDSDFVEGLNEGLATMLAPSRFAALAKMIGEDAQTSLAVGAGMLTPYAEQVCDQATGPKCGPGTESPETAHFSVVDAEGNAVAMTTTVNYAWGSGVFARGTGLVWNDQMDDFAVAPGVPNAYGIVGSEANAVAAGKTPLSSMSPTLVYEGGGSSIDELKRRDLRMVLGSPGGSRIPSTVAQAILHVIDRGADPEQAVTLGRVHHQHLPDQVFVEPFTLDPATRRELESRGHTIRASERTWSNAHLITIDPEGLRRGASDPRGLGAAKAQP